MPERGVYVGASVLPRHYTESGRISSVRRFEKAIGRPLALVHVYVRWQDEVGTASELAYARSGKYLLISWAIPDTKRIASGALDRHIARTARQIAALPTKVFLEVRWEMDRPNLTGTVHGPTDYVAAWDHIRAIFAEQHVDNAAWVWCPTGRGFDEGRAAAYYPGDAEVDWVCADIYPTKPWRADLYQSFPDLAAKFMSWAARRPKPIMIGEFGIGRSYGVRRSRWITGAGAYIKAHPQIKAIAWFEHSRPSEPAYYRWALEGDPPALRAFSTLVHDPYFGRGG